MKTALFTNFTAQEFVGYWDGKARKFTPGQSLWMPDYLARHFAKHLVNQELLSEVNGNLVYKNGDKMTSPKFPEQVPLFMELFNKAYTPEQSETSVGDKKDDVDVLIETANNNKKAEKEASDELQTPVDDEDDEEFEGKPVEKKSKTKK